MAQRYTRKEVGRILGLDARCLRYWEKLRLVRPQSRWGERFYSFGDLAAARTVQQLTRNHIPARRLQRAVNILEQQLGESPLPIQELRLFDQGREIVVIPPGNGKPFNPIRQQWILSFEASELPGKLRPMARYTPEDYFEAALRCETSSELLPQAIQNYQRAVDMAPQWIEAHINLGVAYYQTGRLADAQAEFLSAVRIDPLNGISQYNLGCVLEEQGDLDKAIDHLRRAVRIMPAHADVHFNLALVYEKRGEHIEAREHWEQYLRFAPNGPWAEQARERLRQFSARRNPPAPIPFPRKA